MIRPITEAEEERYKAGIPREKIAIERIWNKRLDGFAIKMPTTERLDFERSANLSSWNSRECPV